VNPSFDDWAFVFYRLMQALDHEDKMLVGDFKHTPMKYMQENYLKMYYDDNLDWFEKIKSHKKLIKRVSERTLPRFKFRLMLYIEKYIYPINLKV